MKRTVSLALVFILAVSMLTTLGVSAQTAFVYGDADGDASRWILYQERGCHRIQDLHACGYIAARGSRGGPSDTDGRRSR